MNATSSLHAVEVSQVRYVYPTGRVVALNGVNLTVERGEIVGIIGQNGSGKTTLTKMLNGLLKPTSGQVAVAGVPTAKRTVQQLSEHVGYVFQNPNHQLFARTIQAELEFGPRNLGLSEDEIADRVRETASFFALDQYLADHPYRVSFAIRKLVGIASIVTMRPSILIFDEPTTGQDHRTTKLINGLIGQLRAQGTTVLCVSHDMPLLADVVERVIVMKDAQIIADASPREVFADRPLMARTNLRAPQATDISLATVVPRGGSIALSPAELASGVAQQLGVATTKEGVR